MGVFSTAALAAGGYAYFFSQREPIKGQRPKDPNFGYEVAIADSNSDGIIDDEDGFDGDSALNLAIYGMVDMSDVPISEQYNEYNYYDLQKKEYGYAGWQSDPLDIEGSADTITDVYDTLEGGVKTAAAIPKMWILLILALIIFRK